ncbi:hypothetical protein LTS10_006622 [Elasticomyces elasticus]|nr:hypothetical protein LTS10_006622 [Elasticomyces elasticus]
MSSHTPQQVRRINAMEAAAAFGLPIDRAGHQAIVAFVDWASTYFPDDKPFTIMTWYINGHCTFHNTRDCLFCQRKFTARSDGNTAVAEPPQKRDRPILNSWEHFREIYARGTIRAAQQAANAALANSSTDIQQLPVPGTANAAIHGSAPLQYGNPAQQNLPPVPQYQQQVTSPHPQPVQQPMQQPLHGEQYQYQQNQPYQALPPQHQQPMEQQQSYSNHQATQQWHIAGSQPQVLPVPAMPTPVPGYTIWLQLGAQTAPSRFSVPVDQTVGRLFREHCSNVNGRLWFRVAPDGDFCVPPLYRTMESLVREAGGENNVHIGIEG